MKKLGLPLFIGALLFGLQAHLLAAVYAFTFHVLDSTGVAVTGATVAVGATTLTPGSPTTVANTAGEKVLTTNANPSASVVITEYEYGNGWYGITEDASYGELFIPLTVSKTGVTILGGSIVGIVTTLDPSNAATAASQSTTAATQATTAATQATTAATQATTAATQATSAAASSSANGTAIAALPTVTTIWAAGTRTLTAQSDTAGITTLLARVPSAFSFTGGNVNSAAQNLPSDYQQRGVAVTLPSTFVSDIAAGVLGAVVDNGLTLQQVARLTLAITGGHSVVASNGDGTKNITFYRANGTTAGITVKFDTAGNRISTTLGTP